MRFLNPVGLFAFLIALPILALYFLRLQRQELVVPSTLLWKAVLVDHHANRPWQKLRRNWLLLLQLLVLFAMVFSLARPALPAALNLQGQVIVLLDASASMQSLQPDERTRFAASSQVLEKLAETFDGQALVTFIAVGPTPQLLLQAGSATDFQRVLDEVRCTDGVANWEAAAALAASLAWGNDVTTVLVTDTAIDRGLPALPGRVRLIQVGHDLPNAGITAFALRRTPEGMTAFVRIYNAGPAAQREFSLYADGALVGHRIVTLPAGEAVSLSFPALSVSAWAEARLELLPDREDGDALALDDHAWVALAGEESRQVLLATQGNRFLNQVLQSFPGLKLEQSGVASSVAESLAASQPTGQLEQSYDLIVADGPLTSTLPGAPGVWLIAPGSGSLCGERGTVFTPTFAVRGHWTHPLLQYIDWTDVHVARAYAYEPPADAEVLIEDSGGPLLWVLDRPGQRAACLAFDLHDSDLPLRTAFPLLVSNLIGWLMPQTSLEPIQALPSGESWNPALLPDALSATLVTPSGERISLLEGDLNALPTQAGLYQLETEMASGSVVHYAALSLLDVFESDIAPRPLVVDGIPVSAVTPTGELGWQDIHRWPLLAALFFLVIEVIFWWRLQPHAQAFQSDISERSPLYLGGSVRQVWAYGLHFSHNLRGLSPVWLILRLLLLLFLVLAFLDVRWVRSTRDLATVFLLDRSASAREAWQDAVDFVEAALATKATRDRAALVVFGRDAWVDRALSIDAALDPIATFPRAEATDIEEALRLGQALIPEGAPGRLVLLTDGLETVGRASRALQDLQMHGVDLLVAPMDAGSLEPDVWLEDLRLPTQVYPGDLVSVAATVGSNSVDSIQLTWAADNQFGQQAFALSNAHSTFVFSFVAEASGFLSLRVCVTAEEDSLPQNNCAAGWVVVQGSPKVLVVGERVERRALVSAFDQAGIETEVREPSEFPLTVQGLADYASVVLVNTPARAFSPQALDALASFVRDLGGGLVTVGGPESYGMGGWLGTSLESALPVTMQVRDPRRFPPLAMVVVIDKSGSMGAEEQGISKIRLAAEAASRVAETLNDADTLAVVAFDDRPADTIGPVLMTERDDVIAQLLRLQAGGGGIYVRESLDYAVDLLRDVAVAPGLKRHILLLADGSDAEHQDGVLRTALELQEEGVTISVVAIGSGSDIPFLTRLAEFGQGRFYLAQHAADLPAIFAEEAAQAKRSYIVEEPFYPLPVSAWEPLDDLEMVPPLQGYVATTPKGASQVVWEATQGDPLLAVWQYGLGRSAAWTADAAGRWASEWVSWESFSRFWGAVLRWTLPPSADTDLSLHVRPSGDQTMVILDVTQPDGTYVDDLALGVQVSRPGYDEMQQDLELRQTAPGRYTGAFPQPEAGALLLRVYGDRNLVTGWAQPYASEYVPGDAASATAYLVSLGGAALAAEPAAAFVHDLQGREVGQPMFPWLLLSAVLLWPVDIAWRRLALSKEDILHLCAWVRARIGRRKKLSVTAPVEAPTTLASELRRRRQPFASSLEPRSTRSTHLPLEENHDSDGVSVSHPPSPAVGSGDDPSQASVDDETLASRLKRRVRH